MTDARLRKWTLAAALACSAVPGLASAQVCAAPAARDFAREAGTAAYLLLVDGTPVASFGDVAHPYRLHSVRKSLLSALVGIEVAKGRIDPDETLASIGIDDYEALSPGEKRATVGDLLASRSGVYRMATHENTGFDAVRPQRGSHPPGTHWFYSNWDFNTAGTIFQMQAGRSICSAFLSELATPLGMRDAGLGSCGWRYSARSRQPAYVFRMSARDLASFGELMRLKGAWQGRQLVPAEWVARSTAPLSKVTKPDGSPYPGVAYGLMWWTAFDGRGHFPGVDDPPDIGRGAFAGIGTGAQMLVVAPALRATFVHFTDTDRGDGRPVDQQAIGRLLRLLLQECLPGARDE